MASHHQIIETKRTPQESSSSSSSSTSSTSSYESYVSSVSSPSSPKVPLRKYEQLKNKGMLWVEKAQTYKEMLQELTDKLELAQREASELRQIAQAKSIAPLPAPVVDSDEDDLEEQNTQLRKTIKAMKKQYAQLEVVKNQIEREILLRDARIQQLTERNTELTELNKELRSILRGEEKNYALK